MAVPTYFGISVYAGSLTTGTRSLPASCLVDDIAIMWVESCGGEPASLSDAQGFVAINGFPVATGSGTAGTQLHGFWKRLNGPSDTVCTVADAGDHIGIYLIVYRGCVTAGDPYELVTTSTKGTASTTTTWPAITTTGADRLILFVAAHDLDQSLAAWSSPSNNGGLTLTQRLNGGTTTGNGGGQVLYEAPKAAAGASGTTTATVSSSVNVMATLALKPSLTPTWVERSGAGNISGDITFAWPVETAVGDVGVLLVEGGGTDNPSPAAPSGWTQVSSSPQATGTGASGTQLAGFWHRVASLPAPAPVVVAGGTYDHRFCAIHVFRGCVATGNPVDAVTGSVKATASTTATYPSVTTLGDERMIVYAASYDDDTATPSGYTNSGVTNITQRAATPTTDGHDGLMSVVTAKLGPTGATGTMSASIAVSSTNAFLTIALKPTSATTSVTTTRATTWTVRTAAATTRATTWAVRSAVNATRASTWAVRSGVTATRATVWAVKASVAAARATTWTVRAGVAITRGTTWSVRTSVAATRASTWTVRTTVGTTRAATWAVAELVTTTTSTTWAVAAGVTTGRATTWSVSATVTTTRASTWVTLTTVVGTRSTTWDVFAEGSVATSRVATWAVLAAVVTTRATTWAVVAPPLEIIRDGPGTDNWTGTAGADQWTGAAVAGTRSARPGTDNWTGQRGASWSA